MRKIVITKNDANFRVNAFLKKLMPTAGLGLIYKYIRTNKIKVNGKKPKPDLRLCEGDELLYFGDEGLIKSTSFTPQKYSLDIVYEDENILILNKPSGIACQPDIKRKSGTLVDFVKSYLFDKGEYAPQFENAFAPALCNRIDFNTSGLVIAAKNIEALRGIGELFRSRKIRRFYLAATECLPPENAGAIRLNLKKDARENKAFVSDDGKYSETRYRVVRRAKNRAVLELEIITGRSHQIRAHLKSIGCPVLGDPKYGKGGTGQRLISHRFLFDSEIAGTFSYLKGREFSIPVDIEALLH